ncbi:hypothetical protein C5B42_01520 [Candidatus Cerribacteria bacterium 'Amazon FNV 2010 28 9']|uniref:Uncharacterized protein n=1 Tax=Candidatus Cerribacteria bacterium 'Amazon FNV 2010 28 9' TaxID=2081795 RepID=A0A317JPN9_9BACT|nr:MAG: hypothetical protein C5B42_01520 [Candidatus Cerribacteria bacterium 'Amazon FNV 2010 28 9']
MPVADIYTKLVPTYQRPDDQDFPVSKLRFFMNVLWEAVTGRELSEDQKVSLKGLIDLLNLLDEHKHESPKEMITAMLPSIGPLLEKMPTLGYTGTVTFTHLVPMYQHYLPMMERMVREAHDFTMEETLLYYEATIFDHLFLMHLFESEHNLNLIEIIATIKAIILTNALVYDYHQHMSGRSISFFTFVERGGKKHDDIPAFLRQVIAQIGSDAKIIVTTPSCIEVLDFLTQKLLETTAKNEAPTTTDAHVQVVDQLMAQAGQNMVFDQTVQQPQVGPQVSEITSSVPAPQPTQPVTPPVEVQPLTTPSPLPIEVPPTQLPTAQPTVVATPMEVSQQIPQVPVMPIQEMAPQPSPIASPAENIPAVPSIQPAQTPLLAEEPGLTPQPSSN